MIGVPCVFARGRGNARADWPTEIRKCEVRRIPGLIDIKTRLFLHSYGVIAPVGDVANIGNVHIP